MPEQRGPAGRPTSGADPFNISRVDAALPPFEGFDFSGSAPASAAPHPTTGNSDPFAPRSPFSQAPRPNAAFPGSQQSQVPPARPQRAGGASLPPPWSQESSPGSPFTPAPGGLSAGSLVDKEALPEWLRLSQENTSAPARATPRSFDLPQAGGNAPLAPAEPPAASRFSSPAPAASPSFFDSASLVDESALPDWLHAGNQTEPLPLPFMVSDSLKTGSTSRERGEKMAAAPAAARGSEAADDDALPEWLRQVYSDAHVPPLVEEKPLAGSGPQKLSGSDLLDVRAMPTWVREAAQTSPLANISDILAFTPPADQPENRPESGAQPSAFFSASGPPAGQISGQSLVDEGHLPAWLRNLGDEGTSASALDALSLAPAAEAERAGSPSGVFSAPELVDTHALPAWLREQESQETPESSARLDQAGPAGGSSGIFSAAELVDTQALPTWLQAQEPKTEQGGQGNTGPAGSPSGVFSAAELVDTQALPAWLQAQPPAASHTSGALGTSGPLEGRQPSSKISPIPAEFSKQRTGEFSAVELVDTKALPTWMKEAAPASGPLASQGGAFAPTPAAESAFSAASLVDTHELPAWMRGAESSGASTSASWGSPGAPPAADPAVSQGAPADLSSGQTGGFSAASLVDSNALPDWLRPAQSGALSASSVSGADLRLDPNEQSGLSAASLINHDDLPEWMRSQGGAQSPEGAAEAGLQARVPHRPRLSTEPDRAPSQAAAHVFSSVLGPTAGEEQWNQALNARSSPVPDMPSVDRSGPLGQRSGPLQGQEWGGAEMGAWNQPQMAPPASQPPGAFASGQEWRATQGAAGAWQVDFGERGMPDTPPERMRSGSRGSGPISGPQYEQQAFSPGEPEEMPGPLSRRQAGRPMPDAGYGMAGERGQPPAGGYGGYAPDPQGRGAPGGPAYQQDYAGWQGGPGYEQGFGDDEAGPPSGMFAKLKRMLGFGGS